VIVFLVLVAKQVETFFSYSAFSILFLLYANMIISTFLRSAVQNINGMIH